MSAEFANLPPSAMAGGSGFRDVGPQATRGPGLVGQLLIVAILMIVQAVLELLVGLLAAAFGAAFCFVPELQKMAGPSFGSLLIVAGGFVALIAGLRLVAGIATLRGQGRMFAIVALLLGLATVPTSYCAPTAIALAIYGLFVLVNETVIEAYEMARRGTPWADVRRHFGKS